MRFEELKIKEDLMKGIKHAGFTDLTLIQEKTVKPALEGTDVVGQSKTGSGKTAAFAIPILEKIDGRGVQAIVLTPTRELCVQVTDVFQQLGKHMNIRTTSVYGGVSLDNQVHEIKKSQVVIGTPGRVLDHLTRQTLNLRGIKFFVLDEVDRMSDMGFIEDVERILSATNKEKQTLLFSATLTPDVLDLVEKHLKKPITIRTDSYVEKHFLKQVYYDIMPKDKFSLLVHLLKKDVEGLKLIFCATRREVDILTTNLKRQGIKVMAIHGGLTQPRRLKALEQLREEKINVLVATDVAARGLDIKNVVTVYNYDVPKTSQEYIHRIGRTARASQSGKAITLLTHFDHENFSRVLQDSSLEITSEQKPNFERIAFQRQAQQRRQTGRGFPQRRGPPGRGRR